MVETTTIIAILVFLVMLFYMTSREGTQDSISRLANRFRWNLLVAFWSQSLLLPQMMDMTPDQWRWLPFLGIFAIIVCGGASVVDKGDNTIHMICAIMAFICLSLWVAIMNAWCLIPLIVCVAAGKDKLIWRAEAGLISSVYMLMLL